MTDILILGGGAAGLAAAIEARHCGAGSVAVLERLERVGKKILSTGNGRCNLLNIHASPGDYNAPDFVSRVFAEVSVESNLAFFHDLGLLTTVDSEGRVYPHSLSASSVLDVLRLECRRLGVRFFCGEAAQTIRKTSDAFLVNGKYAAKKVIVACGGKAAPKQGSDGSGYALLQAFRHRVTRLRPALVQVCTETDFVRKVKGVRTPACLTLHEADGRAHTAKGELLFTEYGLSGIAAMELSRYAKDGAAITIDFLPQTSAQDVETMLQTVRRNDTERPLEMLLTGIVHSRIGTAVLQAVCDKKLSVPAGALTDKELHAIARALKGLSVAVRGTKGFPDAQVTAGGLERVQFTDTLESRLVPGLFAAGEILDVDGKCGGYNRTFAWASGRLAGRSAAKSR